MVRLMFSSKTPLRFLNAPSSFDPRDRSCTMMVESWADSKSFPDSLNSVISERNRLLLVTIPFIVFGACSVYRSYSDFLVADGFIRNAKIVFDTLFHPLILLSSYLFLASH